MYLYTEVTKGKRINHGKNFQYFMPSNPKERTIQKGETVLVITNGTIGQGRIAVNYGRKEAILFLTDLLNELTPRQYTGDCPF